MMTDVCAEKNIKVDRTQGCNIFFIVFMCAAVLSISTLSRSARAATRQDLQMALEKAAAAADKDVAQGVDVINALSVVTAPAQSVTAGVVDAARGTVGTELPIYFKIGAKNVAGLQFDIVLPAGVTVTSVSPGLAAIAANKSTQGNVVTSGYRVIVFAINQTIIPSGAVAVLKVNVNSTATVGKKNIQLANVSASDPAGQSVPLAIKNGSLTVR